MERNICNAEKLAEHVVRGWDMKTLVASAVEALTEEYLNNQELFDEDALTYCEEEE